MVSQLTAYAEILCLLMTLFSAGASARNDIFLQSACSLKFVQVKDGVVIADGAYGDVRPQIFTLEAVLTEPCFPHCGAAITIYSKEAKRYICLDANGRPKSRRLPPDTDKPRRCLFYEQMDGGVFRFQSVEFPAWYLGFHKNGKPIAAGTPGGGGNGGHPGPRARGRGGGGKGGGEGAKGTVPTTGKTGGREKRRRQINEMKKNTMIIATA
uniref:Putative secreted protein n=1 Tax=Anopheles aquasalis TaxID=42839 RepID=T1DNG5_ANOAQ